MLVRKCRQKIWIVYYSSELTRSHICYSTRAFRLLRDLKFLLELDWQATRLPYLAIQSSDNPFIGFIFSQTRYVYQIWFESKLVNAVFRRLSNVKYGAACSRCSTRAPRRLFVLEEGEKSRPFTLKWKLTMSIIVNCLGQ